MFPEAEHKFLHRKAMLMRAHRFKAISVRRHLGHLGMQNNGDSQHHDLIIHRQE